MSSFLDHFTNLVTGFFSWNIDEHKELINYFFITKKHINHKRDVQLFCRLFFDYGISQKFILYDVSKNTFDVLDKKPSKKKCFSSLDGNDKIAGITQTIEGAKKHFSITGEAENTIDVDENHLIDYIKNSCLGDGNDSSNLVQQIWGCVGVDDKSEILRFYRNKLKEAFYYLMKSLLIGEYLILDDFINKLEDCLEKVPNSPADSEMKYLNESLPRFKALIDGSYHVIKSAYSTITDSLSNSKRTTKYAYYVGGVGNHFFYDNNQSTEERFQLAVEALVHVILIDHIFISTPQNIETLYRAAQVIDGIRSFETDDRFLEITTPILDKIYLMLRQMTEDLSEEDDAELRTELRFGDNSIESMLRTRCFQGNSDDVFRLEQTSVFRNFANYDEDADKLKWDYQTQFKTINNLNEFGRNNFLIRRDRHRQIRKGIKSNDPTVFREMEKIVENPNDHKILTTSLLYHAIRYIDNDIDIDGNITFVRKYELMTFLLERLDQLVKSYSSCEIVPNKFGLPFNLNYYMVDDGGVNEPTANHVLKPWSDLKYEQLEDTFSLFREQRVLYFHSAGLKPTNINFLSRFLERQKAKANKQYLEFLRRQEGRISDDVKRQMEIQRTGVQNDLNQFRENAQEELEHQKNSSLQLVGYLGSFIAFVAVATNAFKLPDLSTDDIRCILIVTASCILSFAIMIRAITLPNDKVIKERVLSVLISLLIVIVLAIIMIKALFG